MTPDTEDRVLCRLEGRVEELSALVHQLHADLQQLRAEITAGLQQVNARIDKMLLVMLAIGGGVVAALLGIIAALVVLIFRTG